LRRAAEPVERLGLNQEREGLDISRFRPPRSGPQLDLF